MKGIEALSWLKSHQVIDSSEFPQVINDEGYLWLYRYSCDKSFIGRLCKIIPTLSFGNLSSRYYLLTGKATSELDKNSKAFGLIYFSNPSYTAVDNMVHKLTNVFYPNATNYCRVINVPGVIRQYPSFTQISYEFDDHLYVFDEVRGSNNQHAIDIQLDIVL